MINVPVSELSKKTNCVRRERVMEKAKEIRRSRRLKYRIHILPEEIMTMIFEYLSYKQLKDVVCVCKRWQMIGESPTLWSQFPLTVTKANQFEMPNILKYRRLLLLKEIHIENSTELWGFVKRAIWRHATIKNVIIKVKGPFAM